MSSEIPVCSDDEILLEHAGYRARVLHDAEDAIFVGRILGIRDIVSFHAASLSELKVAFEEAVDDYRETCARIGKVPETDASIGQASEAAGRALA
ncbi:toxin-antitoxin system HicB family antitoxin [Salinarimonas ramus]|uniref:HicB family protein n=1 Tax=Salinarimonas ramus TaxID=690164 RepID=A0A917V3R6_9HYPH|nr:toxin-antitoxin system HicB family antitoxin [Salinarimonas ramus]GGK33103.1 hypothetical protein GCM10011322_19780 [Salinarimonas ramus]